MPSKLWLEKLDTAAMLVREKESLVYLWVIMNIISITASYPGLESPYVDSSESGLNACCHFHASICPSVPTYTQVP